MEIVLGILLGLCGIILLIFSNNTLYCFFFEHETYKWFHTFLKEDINNFYVTDVTTFYRKKYYNLKCTTYPYMYVTYYEGCTTIHDDANFRIVAGLFYERASKKLYNKLLPVIADYEKENQKR